ncbi:MAG: hypothetical protein GC134_06270 [Proteobacteria bacterium]|nr:hypothetical protein [Pseudomonadota bacterium]
MTQHPLATHLREATALCHELITVVNAETDAVRTRTMDKVPELAKRKERLTNALEEMLANVKPLLADTKAKAELAPLMTELRTAVGTYDHAARQNLLVLQAAHQATSIFLDSVRQAVAKPKAETYGKKGVMTDKEENTSLINKSY